ncbi:MAG: SDR family oxidoreductase, partial [Acetobacteraceae bacterium]
MEMSNMANELDGKIAAVTGAASGIGFACAKMLVEAGATVVLIDRDEPALSQKCAALGKRAIDLTLDLLDATQCSQLLSKILAKVDHLDIFHANAGSYIGGEFTETTEAAIDRMLNLNVNVVIKNVHNILPHMIERRSGDIVVTGSVAGHFPVRREPVYAASK